MSIVDTVLHKIFGTPHERKVKQLRPVIAKIHEACKALETLDDAELAAKSAEFREKLFLAFGLRMAYNISVIFVLERSYG